MNQDKSLLAIALRRAFSYRMKQDSNIHSSHSFPSLVKNRKVPAFLQLLIPSDANTATTCSVASSTSFQLRRSSFEDWVPLMFGSCVRFHRYDFRCSVPGLMENLYML